MNFSQVELIPFANCWMNLSKEVSLALWKQYDILFEAAVQASPMNSQVCCPLFHHQVHHCRHGNLAMDRLVGGW